MKNTKFTQQIESILNSCDYKSTWKCPVCQKYNPKKNAKCEKCMNWKPLSNTCKASLKSSLQTRKDATEEEIEFLKNDVYCFCSDYHPKCNTCVRISQLTDLLNYINQTAKDNSITLDNPQTKTFNTNLDKDSEAEKSPNNEEVGISNRFLRDKTADNYSQNKSRDLAVRQGLTSKEEQITPLTATNSIQKDNGVKLE